MKIALSALLHAAYQEKSNVLTYKNVSVKQVNFISYRIESISSPNLVSKEQEVKMEESEHRTTGKHKMTLLV